MTVLSFWIWIYSKQKQKDCWMMWICRVSKTYQMMRLLWRIGMRSFIDKSGILSDESICIVWSWIKECGRILFGEQGDYAIPSFQEVMCFSWNTIRRMEGKWVLLRMNEMVVLMKYYCHRILRVQRALWVWSVGSMVLSQTNVKSFSMKQTVESFRDRYLRSTSFRLHRDEFIIKLLGTMFLI